PHQSSLGGKLAAAAAAFHFPLPNALRRGQELAPRAPRDICDQHRFGGYYLRPGTRSRLSQSGGGATANNDLRFDCRSLAILGATSFRANLVGAGGKLGFRRGFVQKHLTSAAAAHPSMVHRKYRLSSCPSFKPAHPKLPSRGMPQGNCRAAGSAEAHTLRGAAGLALHLVG